MARKKASASPTGPQEPRESAVFECFDVYPLAPAGERHHDYKRTVVYLAEGVPCPEWVADSALPVVRCRAGEVPAQAPEYPGMTSQDPLSADDKALLARLHLMEITKPPTSEQIEALHIPAKNVSAVLALHARLAVSLRREALREYLQYDCGIQDQVLRELTWARIMAIIRRAVKGTNAGRGKTVQGIAGADKKPTPRIRKAEANLKAREILEHMTEEEVKRLTDRDLAPLVGCSPSLANQLPVWEAVKERLGRTRASRHKKPKTVHLTEDMERLVGTGEKDEVLKSLIRQQNAEDKKDEHDAKLFRREGKRSETG